MKPQVALVLICFLLCEVFKASTALKCFECADSLCMSQECGSGDDRCFVKTGSVLGLSVSGKGCTNNQMCDIVAMTCCNSDLCNSAESVPLSLFMMLVPLLSSILFL